MFYYNIVLNVLQCAYDAASLVGTEIALCCVHCKAVWAVGGPWRCRVSSIPFRTCFCCTHTPGLFLETCVSVFLLHAHP